MFNIAHVGCGGISDAWLSYLKTRQDVKMVAMVDVFEESAKAQNEKYCFNAAIYGSLAEALAGEEINLVVDNTPPQYHFDTVSTALKAGCDVLGEKPMSDNLELGYKIVDIAEMTGKSYSIMQNRRYSEGIKVFKELIQGDKLGKVGHMNASFHKNPMFSGFRKHMEHPLIADMAIHTFDQARFIMGKQPVSVYCREYNPSWSWADQNLAAICIFEMEDGTVFNYNGSWCTNGLETSWDAQWTLNLEKGSAYWDGESRIEYETPDLTQPSDHSNPISVAVPDIETNAHHACIEEMLNSLKAGLRSQTDCRDNLKSIEMVYNAIESSKQSKTIVF